MCNNRNNNINKVRNLLIIGNGFDIHCNLDSTFSDFIDFWIHPASNRLRKYVINNKIYDSYLYKENKIKTSRELEDHISSLLNNIQSDFNYINDVSKKSYRDVNNISKYKTINFLGTLTTKSSKMDPHPLNFWEGYLSFLKKNDELSGNIMWNDIESQISYLCNTVNDYVNTRIFKDENNHNVSIIKIIFNLLNNNHETNVPRMKVNKDSSIYSDTTGNLDVSTCINAFLFDRFYGVNNYLSTLVIMAFKYCGFYQYLNDHGKDNSNYIQLFYNFIFDQLSKFEDEFARYLKFNIKYANKNKNFNGKRIRGLHKICNKPYNLITFNYTGNPKEKNCHLYLPIHSDVNHRPIIGISDEDCINKNTGKDKGFFEFSKIFKLMTLNEKETINDLTKGITCIRFYGHSLALADYPYFKYIFDTCHIKNDDNKMKLYFYCTNYNNNPDFKVNQAKSVYKLMDRYSKSLKIKLILEGRLKIIPVDWE